MRLNKSMGILWNSVSFDYHSEERRICFDIKILLLYKAQEMELQISDDASHHQDTPTQVDLWDVNQQNENQ